MQSLAEISPLSGMAAAGGRRGGGSGRIDEDMNRKQGHGSGGGGVGLGGAMCHTGFGHVERVAEVESAYEVARGLQVMTPSGKPRGDTVVAPDKYVHPLILYFGPCSL